MKKFLVTAACLTFAAGAVYAHKLNREQRRLEECGVVMSEILHVPDDIPQDLLNKAECVIVIPSVKKLAFGVNGPGLAGHERPRDGFDPQQQG
jgi:lipid-binding SYLF domain-containing protein